MDQEEKAVAKYSAELHVKIVECLACLVGAITSFAFMFYIVVMYEWWYVTGYPRLTLLLIISGIVVLFCCLGFVQSYRRLRKVHKKIVLL
jgi:lipopolysaccharide export LptBFGC system permease protein LptF